MSKVVVEVGGVTLALSNLDKVLYPEHGFTKSEVIDYYVGVAPVLLPHLTYRPVTRKRFPDGTGAESFFEKEAPSHTPDWVRTARLPTPGSTMGRETVNFVVIDDLPALVWCANLAALELHVPQWRIVPDGTEPRREDPTGVRRARGGIAGPLRSPANPDLLVFDLDPGPPATLIDSCRVGCLLRDVLAAEGLKAYAKTSGAKGLHVYVPIDPGEGPADREDRTASSYAKAIAERLEKEHPKLALSRMDKRMRSGKVFIDWSQNNPYKTTVAPYSLRATEEPMVSTPVTWDEVAGAETPADLRFMPDDVRQRVEKQGDLLEPLLNLRQPLPDCSPSSG